MRNDAKEFRFIDLFAGIGGFRIALNNLSGRCVFTSEWDKFAQITYKENFGEMPEGDITKINASDIPSHDVLAGGFPCQAFSISGKQRGFKDTRGTLFFDVARIAEYHMPRILLLENVNNFERHDNGNTLAVVKGTLNEIGYEVFHSILNSSYFGIPQSRKRIFIVGFRRDLGVTNFKFTSNIGKPVKLKDFLLQNGKCDKYVISRNDITLNKTKITPDIFGNYPQKPIRIGTIGSGGQGERIYSELGHAITLSAYGGGAAAKTGAYVINGKVRKLAPDECKNVMGFPSNFKIVVQETQAYKQFGNAVVVNVVESVMTDILKAVNDGI